MRILHEKKIAEYTTEIEYDKILVAKPRSRNRYCGVCKDNYEDYYTVRMFLFSMCIPNNTANNPEPPAIPDI